MANNLDEMFGIFSYLEGVWKNQALPNSQQGGEDTPLSYCVMPLPQEGGAGFILKNFTYYETLKFNSSNDVASPAMAPNRGGVFQQNAYASFYEQKVSFAEGPNKGNVVHVENGSWLNLLRAEQKRGPYNMGAVIQEGHPKQPANHAIAKQMSVPHGNSILALGSFNSGEGMPTIANAASPLPSPITELDTNAYDQILNNNDDYQNPQPEYTQNVNLPIQKALELISPKKYIQWNVCTKDVQGGGITNIPFEEMSSNVAKYEADYWLLSEDGINYSHLLYSQNITMELIIKGEKYTFPHITSNALTKTS